MIQINSILKVTKCQLKNMSLIYYIRYVLSYKSIYIFFIESEIFIDFDGTSVREIHIHSCTREIHIIVESSSFPLGDYFSPSKSWVLWHIRRRYRSQCANGRRRKKKRRRRRGEKRKKREGKERRETSEPLARSS